MAAPGIYGVQARSSAVEHYLDTVGVGGSIPPVPTGLQRLGGGAKRAHRSQRCANQSPTPRSEQHATKRP
jgi:hypothetical protein